MTDHEIVGQILSVDPQKISVIDSDLRRRTSKEHAGAIRSLLRSQGIKCVRCTTDRHVGGGVSLHIDRPDNRKSWRENPGTAFVARKMSVRLTRIILAAFPDLNDRGEPGSDACFGDSCFRVSF